MDDVSDEDWNTFKEIYTQRIQDCMNDEELIYLFDGLVYYFVLGCACKYLE